MATTPVFVLDVETSAPLPHIEVSQSDGTRSVRLLARIHGVPLGEIRLDNLSWPGLSAADLAVAIETEFGSELREHLRQEGQPPEAEGRPDFILTAEGLAPARPWTCAWRRLLPARESCPLVTVVVAAVRAGPALDRVIAGVQAQTYPQIQLFVVDNRPDTSGIAAAVRDRDGVGYLAERMRGSSAARNAGWRAGRGEIVVFTDDDVVLDPEWCAALMSGFTDPNVGCVTGLILPAELRTEAQVRMEDFGGFSKGFEPRLFSLAVPPPNDPLFPYAVGSYGSGASFAIRRKALEQFGGLAEELGAGTIARGGEDLDLFLNVLRSGWTIRYEPAAIVHHRHRDSDRDFRQQMINYGTGLSAVITRRLLMCPSERRELFKRFAAGATHLFSPKSPKNELKGADFSRHLIALELLGMLYGPIAYTRSLARVRRQTRQRV